MKVTGIIIHHSACSSINGKGYDFFVTESGVVIPSPVPTDAEGHLHICLEGDFSFQEVHPRDREEQFFVAVKLIGRLKDTFGIGAEQLIPHHESCPGSRFPWRKLVLSIPDEYH